MATRSGMIQLGDVRQGRVFFEVRHGFVLTGPKEASPQVWPIERLVVQGRPQKYRTPDGFIWRFDALKETAGRGAAPAKMLEYSPFLSAAIEYSQTRAMPDYGTAIAIFSKLKSAQKFALEFSTASATALDIARLQSGGMGHDEFM